MYTRAVAQRPLTIADHVAPQPNGGLREILGGWNDPQLDGVSNCGARRWPARASMLAVEKRWPHCHPFEQTRSALLQDPLKPRPFEPRKLQRNARLLSVGPGVDLAAILRTGRQYRQTSSAVVESKKRPDDEKQLDLA